MELGGNIELVGFSGQDNNDLIVIKKIVGNYTKHLSETVSGFESLTVTLQEVHRGKEDDMYDLRGRVVHAGGVSEASETDANLYFGLDALLKKLHTVVLQDRQTA